jgi:hypothetical protein
MADNIHNKDMIKSIEVCVCVCGNWYYGIVYLVLQMFIVFALVNRIASRSCKEDCWRQERNSCRNSRRSRTMRWRSIRIVEIHPKFKMTCRNYRNNKVRYNNSSSSSSSHNNSQVIRSQR